MRKLLYLAFLILALGAAGTVIIGDSLVAPQMRDIGAPPEELAAIAVTIPRADGMPIAGWFAGGEPGRPGVLLLHSVRSDRREMLGRSAFLLKAGYSVLLIDMQAHGATPGDRITFGFRESRDVHAAIRFLERQVQPQGVGVIGVSLGGAAALLGGSPVEADAVILEGVYSSIDRAVANRLAIRLGPIGRFLAPLLTWQIEPRLGIPLQDLSPLYAIGRLKAPVMIVGGSEDRHTSRKEMQRMFEAARPPKRLWLIEGAGHEDLHRYAGEEYEQRVLDFLRRHLEPGVHMDRAPPHGR